MPISSSRSRWKFSFGRTSSSSSSPSAPPSPSPSIVPMSFICPISSSLMLDPVIVPTGHTFERACIEACVQFNFTPPPLSSSHLNPSSPSFFLIPNSALRAAIADFCDRVSMPHPSPLSPQSARALVRNLIDADTQFKKPEEEEEAAAAAAEATDSASKTLNQKNPSRFSPSSSTSFSSSSASSFSSSEMITASTSSSSSSSQDESKTPKSSSEASEEASILTKLKSPQLSIKESGLRALRQSTRESSELRVSLCTPKLLQTLVPMIASKNPSTQTNSTAIIVNLSIEPSNKVKIVRSGAVPPLIETLKSSSVAEARDNAAGALFSLALDDENKLAIGVLGAIPPLINAFVSSENIEAGMALYHLSLAPNNLVKITKMPAAVKAVLNIATGMRGGDGERIGLMILASLARRSEGRVALMDAGAVKSMVAMMREGVSGKEEECYCVATMYEMSKGSLRFRAVAKAAGAERALMEVLEGEGGEVAKEMARRTLKAVRGDEEKGFVLMLGDEEDEEDGEKEVRSVVSDGLVSFRRRCDDFGGSSASNSANF